MSTALVTEVREIHRVPGQWRCLHCGYRLQTERDVTVRPACPSGCETPLVALSWKIHGPEQEALIGELRRMLREALEHAEAAHEEAAAVRGKQAGLVQEGEALRRALAATWRLVYWAALASALAGGLVGLLVGRL